MKKYLHQMWQSWVLKTAKFHPGLFIVSLKNLANKFSRWSLAFRAMLLEISGRATLISFKLVIMILIIMIVRNHINYLLCDSYSESLGVSVNDSSLLSVYLIAAPSQLGAQRIQAPYSYLQMPVTEVSEGKSYGVNICFYLTNTNLMKGEDVIRAIYTTLITDKIFLDYSYYKTIIVIGITKYISDQGREVISRSSFHNSVLINNDTPFDKFYEGMCSGLTDKYIEGYSQNTYSEFMVRVWNADTLKNKNVKISINAVTGLPTANLHSVGDLHTLLSRDINPSINNPFAQGQKANFHSSSSVGTGLHKKPWVAPNFNIKAISSQRWDKAIKPIATMDLETMEHGGLQYPVAISIAYLKSDYRYLIKDPKVISKLFLIDLPVNSLDLITDSLLKAAVQQMFNRYLDYCKEHKLEHFLVHNLGAFDGLFLFKALFDYFPANLIKPLMDADHRFIHIQAQFPEGRKIEWRDSFRIFPVGLNDLCANFGVEGKASQYLQEFNNFELLMAYKGEGCKGRPTAKGLLFNKFKKYSLADSESLLKALLAAQKQYFDEFSVDILNIYSTASLAMKVFRQKFFPSHISQIPILKGAVDAFVRQAYLGGATDLYKRYAENVHYYDVNSLYPYAQCMPMPFQCIKWIKQLKSLEGFFGFIEVEVTAPSIPRPVLPVRVKGKTIFPTGTWKGIYFSEELKAAHKLGYQFKLGQAYEFSSEVLFKDYVDYFYNIKRNATGPRRFIAKMMLNNLYGIFGRALQGLKPLIIDVCYSDTDSIFTTHVTATKQINMYEQGLLKIAYPSR
jgi:hypothetical protein